DCQEYKSSLHFADDKATKRSAKPFSLLASPVEVEATILDRTLIHPCCLGYEGGFSQRSHKSLISVGDLAMIRAFRILSEGFCTKLLVLEEYKANRRTCKNHWSLVA
ncbi:hypothetical protein AVEN_32172-1, partial [Araneus ventricosus]